MLQKESESQIGSCLHYVIVAEKRNSLWKLDWTSGIAMNEKLYVNEKQMFWANESWPDEDEF